MNTHMSAHMRNFKYDRKYKRSYKRSTNLSVVASYSDDIPAAHYRLAHTVSLVT